MIRFRIIGLEMTKIKYVVSDGKFAGVRFDCPGCKSSHVIPVTPTPEGYEKSDWMANKHHWGWNGSKDLPTFTPSILTKTGHYIDGNDKECWCNIEERLGVPAGNFKCYLCHCFVRDGMIEFLGDCSHELRGQTVELPGIE